MTASRRLPTAEARTGLVRLTDFPLSCSAKAHVPKPRGTPAARSRRNAAREDCQAACRPPHYDCPRGFSPGTKPGAANFSVELAAAPSVDFLAIANLNDVHDQHVILDFVKNSKVALPNSILLTRTRQFLNADRSWILCERQDSLRDSRAILLPSDRLELFCSGLLDENLITCHCASVLARRLQNRAQAHGGASQKLPNRPRPPIASAEPHRSQRPKWTDHSPPL